MNASKLGRRLGIALAGMALLALAAVPAASAAPRSAGQGNHCTYRLEHISADSSEARIVAKTCFSSFADSFRYATRGQVTVPDSLTPDQVSQSMVPNALDSVVVLGTDWDRANYSSLGASINWEAPTSCTTSQSWTVSYVGNTWNDRIGSAKSYGGCHKFHHWEHGSYGGAVQICQPNCSTFGVMDNQTSSLSWDY